MYIPYSNLTLSVKLEERTTLKVILFVMWNVSMIYDKERNIKYLLIVLVELK